MPLLLKKQTATHQKKKKNSYTINQQQPVKPHSQWPCQQSNQYFEELSFVCVKKKYYWTTMPFNYELWMVLFNQALTDPSEKNTSCCSNVAFSHPYVCLLHTLVKLCWTPTLCKQRPGAIESRAFTLRFMLLWLPHRTYGPVGDVFSSYVAIRECDLPW